MTVVQYVDMAVNQTARRLGGYMRAMRIKAGVSTYDVERLQLNITRRTLGRAEKGETSFNWPTWRVIARHCGATQAQLEEIEQMARQAGEKGWWEENRKGMMPKFQRYVAMEAEADQIRILEVELVNGLFQIAEYVKAINVADPFSDNEHILAMIEARERRQHEVLEGLRVPTIQVVLTEGALLRQIGGPLVHAQQIEHLRLLYQRPEIDLRVLPNELGAYPPMNGSFTLLEFDDTDDVDTVYIEARDGCRYVESRDVVGMYRTIYEAAFEQATPLEEFLE